jgi:hypothetical protein
MKSVFAFGASFAGAALLVVIPLASLAACSSTTAPVTAAPDYGPQVKCDETQCERGNKCLAGDGELRCRRPCSSNTDSATNCPAGATCVAASSPSTIPPACVRATDEASAPLCAAFGTGGGVRLHAFTCGDAVPKDCVATATAGTWCCSEAAAEVYATPFCVKQLATITAGPKQWGNACNATGGLDNNPDCDSAQGFFCYGTSPADGASYCTRYDCHADRECAPGFYCGTINVGPNVTTPKATVHETTTACLRREYCAPCSADFDCPMLNNLPQHCVPDDNSVGFCAPECTATDNCPKDAKCIDGGIGIKTCYPRAGKCVGDGTLCSPCRNDADCGDDGACVRGQYTTERSCAKKSAITCKTGAVEGTDFKCPASANPKATIRCRGDVFEQVPKDYCHGLYPFVDSADVGCWTPAKL